MEQKQEEFASAARRWEELRPADDIDPTGARNDQVISAEEQLVESRQHLVEVKQETADAHK